MEEHRKFIFGTIYNRTSASKKPEALSGHDSNRADSRKWLNIKPLRKLKVEVNGCFF